MPLHHRVTEDSEIPLFRPVALIFVAGSSLSIDQAPPAGWRSYEMSDEPSYPGRRDSACMTSMRYRNAGKAEGLID